MVLDELRNKVTPTVPDHHRLRIIASDYVDLMERIEHVKLNGQTIHLSEAEIIERNNSKKN